MEDANPGLLSESSKKILLHRGSQPVEGGLVLKRDVRAKTSRTSVLPLVTQKEIVSRYNGDMLIFKCRHKFSSPDLQCVENEFVDIYRTRCKRFHYVELQGGHYVHLNNPELLAPTINTFILASPCQKANLWHYHVKCVHIVIALRSFSSGGIVFRKRKEWLELFSHYGVCQSTIQIWRGWWSAFAFHFKNTSSILVNTLLCYDKVTEELWYDFNVM